MTISLRHINEGIEALRAVRTYLWRLFHDHGEVWDEGDDTLAVAVEMKLRHSTELWQQLFDAAMREKPEAPDDAA